MKTLNSMILPKNGGVVVIDDQPNEALPIIRAMSKKGIPTTYYQGNKASDLPDDPIQIVRLVFLDLQLIESSDEHQIAKSIVNVLQKIISEENGPYILVIWSKNSAKYSVRVQEEIKHHPNLRPSSVIEFNKRDCLEEKIVNSVDEKEVIQKVLGNLKGRLDDEDEGAVTEAVEKALSDEFHAEFVAKSNAIEIIEQHIKEGLEKAGVFHLFVIWENLIHQSGARTVQAISDTIETTDLWEHNMRDVIKRMAKARTGKNEISDELALEASLTTFTYSFSEELESRIRNYQFPKYIDLNSPFIIAKNDGTSLFEISSYIKDRGKEFLMVKKDGLKIKDNVSIYSMENLANGIKAPDNAIVNELAISYDKIPPLINTKLHLEIEPTKELIPGNVYKIDVSNDNKGRYLATYFDKIEEDLSQYTFIELEVSPICDYAQTKWKKSRLISGVVYNGAFKANSHFDHLYAVQPKVIIDGKPQKIIFDFHLFKSLDHDIVEKREIWFRLKRELLLDIIANLSGHVNRPGISFME